MTGDKEMFGFYILLIFRYLHEILVSRACNAIVIFPIFPG